MCSKVRDTLDFSRLLAGSCFLRKGETSSVNSYGVECSAGEGNCSVGVEFCFFQADEVTGLARGGVLGMMCLPNAEKVFFWTVDGGWAFLAGDFFLWTVAVDEGWGIWARDLFWNDGWVFFVGNFFLWTGNWCLAF